LALTSPASGGRSFGIVRSRTKALEFSFFQVFGLVGCSNKEFILEERSNFSTNSGKETD
jgi:hypothetical protein